MKKGIARWSSFGATRKVKVKCKRRQPSKTVSSEFNSPSPSSSSRSSQQPCTMVNPRKAVVVGISGCSSSGKTTISRLLRDIFPNTFVLHEDDFYLPEAE
jgi:ABC-type glutathione transport system ATPase component